MKQTYAFASRVQLYSPGGRWLSELHAAEAARLIQDGAAAPMRANGKVRAIELGRIPGRPCGPPSTPSVMHYAGQRYTRVEAVADSAGEVHGHCYEFKFIHPDDQALFMMAITDCGGDLRSARR